MAIKPVLGRKARLQQWGGFPASIAGLVGWLKFDELGGVLVDSSGRGNNGTAVGGPVYGVAGKIATALQFDGVDDYIVATNTTSITSTQISVVVWVKFTALTSNPRIIDLRDGANGLQLIVDSASGNWGTKHSQFQGTENGTSWTSPSTGVWYHVAAVWDSVANTTAFYQDSVAQSGTAQTGFIGSGNQNNKTYVGVRSDLAATFFTGVLDDLLIYNTALTSAQVTQLYNYRG